MKKLLDALNEAVDALGDMPAEDVTEQQRRAYRLCVEVRDELGDNSISREEQ